MVEVVHLNQGLLRVVPPAALDRQLQAEAEQRAAIEAEDQPELSGLAGHIRTQFDRFKRHRDTAHGWTDRLLHSLRTFNGEYSPTKLAEIRKFGGSEVFARIVAMKCRGASSLLRDVYLTAERPWGIAPPADPDVPPEIVDKIHMLVGMEAEAMLQAGQNIEPSMIRDRTNQLMEAARKAEKKQARNRAEISEERIEELLSDGGFYKALAEFLVDLPLFPFACIKGPVVRIVPTVSWDSGMVAVHHKPKMFWQRVSPFDLWWSPGVSDIEDAEVIERVRFTRGDLNDLLDLPGYNHDAIRQVLTDYSEGYEDTFDSVDTERAEYESRENPQRNETGLISCLEYHGNVQGRLLLEYGFTEAEIQDPIRDYAIQAWLIGRHLIKVQFSPSPRRRHPYFVTSFEKVPGTPVGNGLPDILADIQEVSNAVLRALVNNLSIASGPQVVINRDRLSPGEDAENLYPWKRWYVESDPTANNTQPPISFFQPHAHAQELLQVYKEFSTIADEISAIPKYMSGQGVSSGAGRTAAGLAMLMGNASKILQMVAANIDRDVFDPLLTQLFDLIMLTDETGMLRGDESVKVMGVNVAVQRETERARQLEFLQITANPMDAQIMGVRGRAAVLRPVAETIGLDGEQIIPDEDELAQIEQQMQAQAMSEAGASAQGSQQGGGVTGDVGPRVNIAGGAG